MALKGSLKSIIRPWSEANFSAETYAMVYCSVDSNAVINGQPVFLVATTQLDFNLKSISADTANVYVVGANKNVVNGGGTLSNYPQP